MRAPGSIGVLLAFGLPACAEDVSVVPLDQRCPSCEASCELAPAWGYSYPAAAIADPREVVVSKEGHVYVAGLTSSSPDFGGGVLQNHGGNDIFVVSLDASGVHRWSKIFGTADYEGALAAAVDSRGNVIVGGFLSVPLDFGSGEVAGASFVLKLDTHGEHVWSYAFGGPSMPIMAVADIAIDELDHVVVAGTGPGPFGGAPDDVFVTRLSPDGVPLWSQSIPSHVPLPTHTRVATGPAGAIALASTIFQQIEIGGQRYDTQNGLFVTRLDADGSTHGTHIVRSVNGVSPGGLAFDRSGTLIVTGRSVGGADFGTGSPTPWGGVFLFALLPNGELAWHRVFGGDGYHEGEGTGVVANDGFITLIADANGIDFGGGQLGFSTDTMRHAVARFDACATHLSSAELGPNGSPFGGSLAAAPDGSVLLTGSYIGSIDFGAASPPDADTATPFIAKLNPVP